jgi:hypothetical protein
MSIANGITPADLDQVIFETISGQKVAAIKALRSVTSLGLKESKDVVDKLPVSASAGTVRDTLTQELIDLGFTVFKDTGALALTTDAIIREMAEQMKDLIAMVEELSTMVAELTGD